MKLATFLGLVTILAVAGGGLPAKPASAASDDGGANQLQSDENTSRRKSIDEQFAEVATRVPEFGGLFLDTRGRPTMYVIESQPGVPALAQAQIAASLLNDDRITGAIHVLPGRYGFQELKDWHEVMSTDVLAVPGVTFTDIAEANNRLRIGVENPDVEVPVEQQLARLGVPREAVIIDVTEPIQFAASVRNRVRPLKGGLQINFGNFICTMGFLAVRAGVSGMVTNSHCTTTQGGVQNTVYHQPSASGSTNRIGLEIRDPLYFTGGACPAGRKCRYSDSAFARVPNPSGPAVSVSRGFLARTTGLSSITISTTSPAFRIVAETSRPLFGETLNKIGRTTGWTRGLVVGTCVTTNVAGSNITQLCQDFVNARIGSGDSGSPVFRVTNSPAAGDVRLYGILWGGSSSGTQFVFSAIGSTNVQRSTEMGSLSTCAPGFGC